LIQGEEQWIDQNTGWIQAAFQKSTRGMLIKPISDYLL